MALNWQICFTQNSKGPGKFHYIVPGLSYFPKFPHTTWIRVIEEPSEGFAGANQVRRLRLGYHGWRALRDQIVRLSITWKDLLRLVKSAAQIVFLIF